MYSVPSTRQDFAFAQNGRGMEGSIGLIDSIRSSAYLPAIGTHMKMVPDRTKTVEPLIQSIYLSSFCAHRLPGCFGCKRYSNKFELGNTIIFLIFYDLSAFIN